MKRSAMKRTYRNTGPNEGTRERVIGRAQGRCERCGKDLMWAPYSIHHRLPRGRGGQNRLSNLVLLCGSATTPDGCHNEVESHRTDAYVFGWLVETGFDPAVVPVNLYGRGMVLLDDDGGVVDA